MKLGKKTELTGRHLFAKSRILDHLKLECSIYVTCLFHDQANVPGHRDLNGQVNVELMEKSHMSMESTLPLYSQGAGSSSST